MVFSKRERYVAIAVALAVGVFAVDRYLLTPYLTRLDEVGIKQLEATRQLEEQTRLFNRQAQLQDVWTAMRSGGALVPDASEAEAQLMNALQEWADESGVKVGTRKAEQPVPAGDFKRTGVQFSGRGSMASVSRFLWRLETAHLPIRVSELTLRANRENTDDLIVQLNVSTLSIVPGTDRPAGDRGGPGGGRAMAPAATPLLARGGQS